MASAGTGEVAPSRLRSRSRSPVRSEPKPKRQKDGGFKWKDKKPRDEDAGGGQDDVRLKRGYRDRSPRKDSYGERERDTSTKRDGNVEGDMYRDRSSLRQRESNSYYPRDTSDKRDRHTEPPPKAKKERKPKVPVPAEPMIIVNINDRLGTKAAIPCLASDSVKAFKAIVAAHIGRQPHEIMLKRQGERPFKDQLTLQDYGVSGGVQLDLEIDTGD